MCYHWSTAVFTPGLYACFDGQLYYIHIKKQIILNVKFLFDWNGTLPIWHQLLFNLNLQTLCSNHGNSEKQTPCSMKISQLAVLWACRSQFRYPIWSNLRQFIKGVHEPQKASACFSPLINLVVTTCDSLTRWHSWPVHRPAALVRVRRLPAGVKLSFLGESVLFLM